MNQESQDTLTSIRMNLEDIRCRLSEPLKRIHDFRDVVLLELLTRCSHMLFKVEQQIDDLKIKESTK